MKDHQPLLSLQPTVDSLNLVSNQRVHGIEDKTSHAPILLPFGRTPEICQHRREERFCLAEASSGCNHEGWPGLARCHGFTKRFRLVVVQKAIHGEDTPLIHVPTKLLREYALIPQGIQGI